MVVFLVFPLDWHGVVAAVVKKMFLFIKPLQWLWKEWQFWQHEGEWQYIND